MNIIGKKIGVFIGVIVIILLVLITIYNSFQKPSVKVSQQEKTTFPTTVPLQQSEERQAGAIPPSLIPGNSESYRKSGQIIALTEAPLLKQEKVVGKLQFKMPYKGTNFQMDYDYKLLQYIVIIPNDKISEGNTEFDTFLKQNGIADRSWIRKELLVIRYE